MKFQSTLPREERHTRYQNGEPVMGISIHAPTRGATAVFFASISIHAPTRGATEIQFAVPCDYEFQSTLPREERPYFHFHCSISLIFQSTLPREERRKADRCTSGSNGISIHAPTRGATISNVDFKSIPYISIHAPTRGATYDIPFSSVLV